MSCRSIVMLMTFFISAVVCGMLVYGDMNQTGTSGGVTCNADKEQHAAKSRAWYEHQWEMLARGAFYPNLPKELDFRLSGKSLCVLQQAKNRSDIVAWVDGHPDTQFARLKSIDNRWLIIMHTHGSGWLIYTAYLYGYRPVDGLDPMPWKLLYIGDVGSRESISTDCVYIDEHTKSLVFASRSGKRERSVDISSVYK